MYNSLWLTNLANASASIMAYVPRLNWAGFYLQKDDRLVLGPFQGLPACLEIPKGKGVCGTAAEMRKSIVVADVHDFPGHIVCDSRSRSEIVIPMLKNGRLIGVLDLDSPEVNRFGPEDRAQLEMLVTELVASCDWPEKF